MQSIFAEKFKVENYKISPTKNCFCEVYVVKIWYQPQQGTGWVDGWMDGWIDGWMGGWVEKPG